MHNFKQTKKFNLHERARWCKSIITKSHETKWLPKLLMAREPFNSVYLDERPIEQYAKKREMIFLHEGSYHYRGCEKEENRSNPPSWKKKRTSSESTFIRSLVDDPDNLPVMVARPPGQSDVIKTRKFHGHRLPSATNRTRDVSFYDPWYPCTSIMQIRMKVTKRCSWRICIYIYSRGEKWRQARSFPRGSKSSLWRAIECMHVVYVCTYLVYRVNR